MSKDSKILRQRFLSFRLGDEHYAVPLSKVREVTAHAEATKIPNAPLHFKGVLNLRGQTVSIIDLRLKFNLPDAGVHQETAIIILDLAPICLGIVVDSIEAVIAIAEDEISPPPGSETSINTEFISGIARLPKNLVLILDIEKALDFNDQKAIESLHQLAA